jgi:transcriptional regulator with XRE-family HTH domain
MGATEFWSRVSKLQGDKNDAWLSGELGVTHSTVSTWKRRGTIPKEEMLQRFAKVFGVRIEYLLNGWEYLGTVEVQEDQAFDPLFLNWADQHESLLGDLMELTDEQLRMVEDQVAATASRNRDERKKAQTSAG